MSNETRGLGKTYTFLVLLLFSFAFLLETAPYQFLGDTDQDAYERLENPDVWYAETVASWNQTFRYMGNATIYKDGTGYYADVEQDDDFRISWTVLDTFQFFHQFSTWIIPRSHQVFYLGGQLTEEDLIANIDYDENPQISRINVECSHYTWTVLFSYNGTTFATLEDALDGVGGTPELYVFVGLGWDETISSINAWSLIGQLLTFQAPEIHPTINVIIAVPIWISIIYVAFRFLLWVIPLVG